MAAAKDCHALTSYFDKKYFEKYDRESGVNRFSARWGFDAMLGSLSVVQVKTLIDYYLTNMASTRRHDLDWFFYNYEKVTNSMLESRDASSHREKLLIQSRERAEAWRNSGRNSLAD